MRVLTVLDGLASIKLMIVSGLPGTWNPEKGNPSRTGVSKFLMVGMCVSIHIDRMENLNRIKNKQTD